MIEWRLLEVEQELVLRWVRVTIWWVVLLIRRRKACYNHNINQEPNAGGDSKLLCKQWFRRLREGAPPPEKKTTKVWHMSKLGLPYLLRSLVWTKKSLDEFSYCLPYLPIQKVWTFFNWSLTLNIYFLTFVLLVNNNARYHQGHL